MRSSAAVLAYALSLAEASDGAYDVTVGPLVNLWGFGPDPATNRVPDAAAIEAARAQRRLAKVEVDRSREHRARKQPGMRVDLSSLGKGRGVDRVAEYLDAQGVTNYLIDLSGKLRARGRNARGALVAGRGRAARGRRTVRRAARSSRPSSRCRMTSVATAGDYRRFFESRRPPLFAHHRSAHRISGRRTPPCRRPRWRPTACRPTRSPPYSW